MQINSLKSYLVEKNIKMSEFSQILGVTLPYLSVIASGKVIPSKRLSNEINRLTEGVINIKKTSVN